MAALYLPDGLIRRPSVYLWKSITGIGFFYLAVLIYFVYLVSELPFRTETLPSAPSALTSTPGWSDSIMRRFRTLETAGYTRLGRQTPS